MVMRAARKAWNFEMRLEEGKRSKWARKCHEEVKKREKKEKRLSRWEEERRGFFIRLWIEGEEIERLREMGREGFGKLERRYREVQREKMKEKIRNTKYNRWYAQIRSEEVPEYLRKGWGKSRWQRVARFSLGNEVKEGRYWEKEENRKCRVCGYEEETWEHV